jgi:hypothetical protein
MRKDFTVTIEEPNRYTEITFQCEVTRTKQTDGDRTWWEHNIVDSTPTSAIICDTDGEEEVWRIGYDEASPLLKRVMDKYADKISDSLSKQATDLVNSYQYTINRDDTNEADFNNNQFRQGRING